MGNLPVTYEHNVFMNQQTPDPRKSRFHSYVQQHTCNVCHVYTWWYIQFGGSLCQTYYSIYWDELHVSYFGALCFRWSYHRIWDNRTNTITPRWGQMARGLWSLNAGIANYQSVWCHPMTSRHKGYWMQDSFEHPTGWQIQSKPVHTSAFPATKQRLW